MTTLTAIDFEQLTDVAGDGIVISDAKGIITYWNDACTRIFGFTKEDAIGESLDIIIPDNQQKPHWDGYEVTMNSGETKYGTSILRVPAVNKAGERISIAFSVALLKDDQGKVTGIAAIVRDETEQFSANRKIRKELSALKATIKAKENQ